MLIQNKTALFQKCEDKVARPWRTLVVSDDAEVDETKFEILGKTTESKKTKEKIE